MNNKHTRSGRTLWFVPDLETEPPSDLIDRKDVTEKKDGRVQVDSLAEANLVSSLCGNGMHKPALDLDFNAQLFRSRDIGHHHLYLDKAMSWEQYEKLLDVMAEVGLLEPGYVSASKERQQTFLRLPVVTA